MTARLRPAGYKLLGHVPVAVDDVLEWATWFEANRCSDATRVALTNFPACYVSTVFLPKRNAVTPRCSSASS